MIDHKQLLRLLTLVLGLLGLWQLLVMGLHLPNYLLPSPGRVFATWIVQAHFLWQQTQSTLLETLLGLLGATLIGMGSALVITYFKPLRRWLFPILIISQALPTFAIAPLFVVWLGYGMASKIATTMLILYFPITTAFYDGLRRTPRDWLELASSMKAIKWRVLWHIRVPAALPSLASGLRIATAMAPIGAVVSEWVGSAKGLGFVMMNANARLQIDLMFAALLTVTLMSLLLYFVVDYGLRRLLPWVKEV